MFKFFSSILIVLFTCVCSAQQLNLMSYNIKYANENDGENSWSKRKEFLADQIQFYEPEIIGLQEALKLQIDHFLLKIGEYGYLGVAREDGKEKGEYTAILYKKEEFDVIDTGNFWLSETPGKVSTGWDAALPRICTYARFRNKNSKAEFWVFNTHFDHKGKNARTKSAELILEKIAELNTNALPVFLLGDLNLEPDAEGVLHIMKELKDSKSLAKHTFGPTGTFNGFQFDQPVERRIDYIFVSEQVLVKKHAVLSDSKDLKYPSDHLPVLIETEIR
ncbi:endonuclease/exonuclease/phosphatase family protein [Christiangramia portivictoriae]|uniref:endonuclease/exonuclease/phosphatase family protein n=1 Tax=Christiangramia portivictoriae TaxID=326069 RepID=UPI0004179A0B|nr:endonuclease/exonuclease/phosphatase family protein [Christiangramia portivictoriae]